MGDSHFGVYDSTTPFLLPRCPMAWIELDHSGNYHVSFRLGERRYKRSLKTTKRQDAEWLASRLEENLSLVERGRLAIPDGADIPRFLLSDGKVSQKLTPKKVVTLENLMTAYFDSLPAGAVEESTIQGMRIHERHLCRLLGETFAIQSLTPADLQRYVDARSREPGIRGRKVTATTIKKALVTLKTAWNWAVKVGLLHGKFPNDGLRYAKSKERPVFQTWEEIERQIKRGGLSEVEQADLWDCLFLTLPEVAAMLEEVRTRARHPFIYPMFVFAAHTGARRSEIIRCRLSDVDLEAGVVTIRERKRDHSRTTTRRVPISPFLKAVLSDWLTNGHPGGDALFCHRLEVARSKTNRKEVVSLTRDEMHDHLRRTLAGSRWAKVRGWHCLRHSFASNLRQKELTSESSIPGWGTRRKKWSAVTAI